MTDYAALDVSLRAVNICVIDTEGKIKAETKLPSEVEDIRAYLQSLEVEIAAVGFEAGTLKHAQKHGSPHPPTNACSGLTTDQSRLRRGA